MQYIRVYGYGNSEGSGWNSYEEVQVFGNDTCDSLTLVDAKLTENQISFYPNPAKSKLNIVSNKNDIGLVEVFDLLGKKIVSKRIQTDKGYISTPTFSKGIYLIKIDGSLKRFMVE